jgi:hypothetical protein
VCESDRADDHTTPLAATRKLSFSAGVEPAAGTIRRSPDQDGSAIFQQAASPGVDVPPVYGAPRRRVSSVREAVQQHVDELL